MSQQEQPSGFLFVDKSAGMTSHDVIDVLRKKTGIKKIGHAGTLDPFATGLLICAVGRQATKRISEFSKMDKVYEATFVLGATSETLDPESDIVHDTAFTAPTEDEIKQAVQSCIGASEQIPPMYSAIKIGGKKLYDLARQGKTVERPPRPITIFDFDVHSIEPTDDGLLACNVTVHVSSGTYIRCIARDLGEKLGTTGYVTQLRRTKIGPHSIEDAKILDDISSESWRNLLLTL